MTKHLSHEALDAAFAFIANHADVLTLCDGPPEDAAAALAPPSQGGQALGAAVMLTGIGAGDYFLGPGAYSGRRLTIAAQDAVDVSEDGAATHAALVDACARRLLLVTPLKRPIPLQAGQPVALESFSDEIRDPE